MRLIIGMLFLCMALANPATADGDPHCATRDALHGLLKTKHGEEVIAIAVTESGLLLEILASPRGETMSVTVTRQDGGEACLMASGYNLDMRRLSSGGFLGTEELQH